MTISKDPSRPARVKCTDDTEFAYGVFYTSTQRLRHIIPYVPYAKPPRIEEALCGTAYGIPTSTKDVDHMCSGCLAVAERQFGAVVYE